MISSQKWRWSSSQSTWECEWRWEHCYEPISLCLQLPIGLLCFLCKWSIWPGFDFRLFCHRTIAGPTWGMVQEMFKVILPHSLGVQSNVLLYQSQDRTFHRAVPLFLFYIITFREPQEKASSLKCTKRESTNMWLQFRADAYETPEW